jgi:hypothetical protein
MSATQYFGDHWSFSAAWAHAGNIFAFLVSLLLLCGVPSLLSASQIDSAQVAKKVTAEGKLMTRQQWRGPRTRAPYLTMIGQAVAPDTRVTIISDHIGRQGYPCDEPRQAEHDQQASRPNDAVWFLRCQNALQIRLISTEGAQLGVQDYGKHRNGTSETPAGPAHKLVAHRSPDAQARRDNTVATYRRHCCQSRARRQCPGKLRA